MNKRENGRERERIEEKEIETMGEKDGERSPRSRTIWALRHPVFVRPPLFGTHNNLIFFPSLIVSFSSVHRRPVVCQKMAIIYGIHFGTY